MRTVLSPSSPIELNRDWLHSLICTEALIASFDRQSTLALFET